MIEIMKSQLNCSQEEFSENLQKLRKDMEEHIMGEPGIPAPSGHDLLHALIERIHDDNPNIAVRKPDRFVIRDYRIIPDPIDVRRSALLSQLNEAAAAARAKILSTARLQLLQIDSNAALMTPEDERTKDQVAAIKQLTEFNAKASEIFRTATVAAIQIEELTQETIDGWKVPAF